MNTVSQRVRWLRETTGLSQRMAATLAGLRCDTHVGLIEARDGATLHAKTAERLCALFDCSMDWLVSGRGKAPSKRTVKAAVNRARRLEETDAAE